MYQHIVHWFKVKRRSLTATSNRLFTAWQNLLISPGEAQVQRCSDGPYLQALDDFAAARPKGSLDEPSLTETVNSECSCSSLDRRAATRPQFVGFEATSLVASVMLSRVQAGRRGIQVAARPKPAVLAEECQIISNDPGRCYLRSANANVCTVPRKFLCRWTMSLEQSTQHSATAWHGLWTVRTTT